MAIRRSQRFLFNNHMDTNAHKAKGFTLIEVVVSLIIVSILAVFAGMGIVSGTKGYLQAKENVHISQKVQLAMSRINQELMEMTDISIATSNPTYIRYRHTGTEHTMTIDADSNIRIDNHILIDNVHHFSLQFYNSDTETYETSWNNTNNINDLSLIQINMGVNRANDSDHLSFNTHIHPRNTNNYGGIPPSDSTAISHYACFINTASYDHQRIMNHWIFFVIPFISLWLWLLYSVFQKFMSYFSDLCITKGVDVSGNVLVGLIVIILIFAILGAGLLSLTRTSTTNQLTSNNASKAYYLAESGFRYAAGRYLNANPNDRNPLIHELHNENERKLGEDGQFTIDIYPYFLLTSRVHHINERTINVYVPGETPDHFNIPSSSRLKVGTQTYGYSDFSLGTFAFILETGSSLVERIDNNSVVSLVTFPDGSSTSITNGGNLSLTDASFFPLVNGKFTIYNVSGFDSLSMTYQLRNGNVLHYITYANDPEQLFNIPISTSNEIVLEPFVSVKSTGSFGSGDLQATREVIYNIPLPAPNETAVFRDRFENRDRWNSEWGTHDIQNPDDDPALKIISTDDLSIQVPKASLASLNWEETNYSLMPAYMQSGGFLSYDVQVKIGFDPNPPPEYGYQNHGTDIIPRYFTAGISFRLSNDRDSFGISLMRGHDGAEIRDNIDDAILPVDDTLMIVLWQQTLIVPPPMEPFPERIMDRQWLAYKILPMEFSPQEATLLIRIIEAVPLWFSNGNSAIRQGDLVYQEDGTGTIMARGKVAETPILSSGSWSGGNASGILLLNNLPTGSIFNPGSILISDSSVANCVDFSSAHQNYIRVYYSNPVDSGGNGIATDHVRHANFRNSSIHWPVQDIDRWSAENDYFTLVQWDNVQSAEIINSSNEPNAIIRTDPLVRRDGTQLSSNPNGHPEIGLHTFGHGSTNVYFDDFAFQQDTHTGLLPPIQQ